jgi:hypothetical protein
MIFIGTATLYTRLRPLTAGVCHKQHFNPVLKWYRHIQYLLPQATHHTHSHWNIHTRLISWTSSYSDLCHDQWIPYPVYVNNTGQQKLTFFVPRTSIGELSSTFYAEFSYAYRIFLSGGVSKIQRNLIVQNSTLRAHETGRNIPIKCSG